MTEIWKDIPEYEGIYQVSNKGRVRSLDRQSWNGHAYFKLKGRVLKPNVDRDGYCIVHLNNRGRRVFKIHRLVAQAFIPNPSNFPVVNHLDKNPSNNNVTNLEWTTIQGNNEYDLAKPIYVIYPDGTDEWYKSIQECLRQIGDKYKLDSRPLWKVLQYAGRHYHSLGFEYA